MKNPILQDIKREYPLAYEMATQACSVLQDVSPNPIKEDEIGYIAVSFALALERQKAKEWAPKNILIVCASLDPEGECKGADSCWLTATSRNSARIWAGYRPVT